MLVTSNRAVSEWGTVFGDAVVATAILDRLLHHSHVHHHPRRQLPLARETPVRTYAATIGGEGVGEVDLLNQGVNSKCRPGVKTGCRLTAST